MMRAAMTIPEPTGKDAEEAELQERGSPRRSWLVHRGQAAATARTLTSSSMRCELFKAMSGATRHSVHR